MGQMHEHITIANYTLAPVDTSIHQPRSTGSMCALTEDEPESLTLCRCIASSIALRGYGDSFVSFIHPAHAGAREIFAKREGEW
jgi:hypothetical protein